MPWHSFVKVSIKFGQTCHKQLSKIMQKISEDRRVAWSLGWRMLGARCFSGITLEQTGGRDVGVDAL